MTTGGRVSFVGLGSGDPRHLTHAAGKVLASADLIIAPPDLPADLLSAFGRAPVTPGGDPMSTVREALREGVHLAWAFRGDAWESGLTSELVAEVAGTGADIEIVDGVSLLATARSAAGVRFGEDAPVLEVNASRRIDIRAIAQHLRLGGVLRTHGSRDEIAALVRDLGSVGCGSVPAVAVARAGSSTQRSTGTSLQGLEIPRSDQAIVLFAGTSIERDEALTWFERRPLYGRRIIVTRPRHQAEGLAADLRALGATVLVLPIIRITDPPEPEALLDAAREIGGYEWVVFTSANGVDRFWQALDKVGLDTRALGGVKICAIGPATADSVRDHGAGVDLLPDEYVAESVIEAFKQATDVSGRRILLPRAEIARDILPDTLTEMGARVNEVAAYQTVPDEEGVAGLREAVREGGVDLVTFTSSSTVRNFAELVSARIGEIGVASIGPITSSTAREYGWPVTVEAAEHTSDGLVEAIAAHYRDQAK